jgi:hypothetical protein
VSVSDEIRASAAAHRDLGPGYENAVAEGLVERIGEEIDRRVDARLYGSVRQHQVQPPEPAPRPRHTHGGLGVGPVFMALGSMSLGIAATAVVLHPGSQSANGGMGVLVALIWIVIGIINVTYARRR